MSVWDTELVWLWLNHGFERERERGREDKSEFNLSGNSIQFDIDASNVGSTLIYGRGSIRILIFTAFLILIIKLLHFTSS